MLSLFCASQGVVVETLLLVARVLDHAFTFDPVSCMRNADG